VEVIKAGGTAVLPRGSYDEAAQVLRTFCVTENEIRSAANGTATPLHEPCGQGPPGSVRESCGAFRKLDRTQKAARVIIDGRDPESSAVGSKNISLQAIDS